MLQPRNEEQLPSEATSIKIQLKAFYNATRTVRLTTSHACGMTKYWVSFLPPCLQIQYRSSMSIITLVMKTSKYTLNYSSEKQISQHNLKSNGGVKQNEGRKSQGSNDTIKTCSFQKVQINTGFL